MRSAFNGIPYHRGQGNMTYSPIAANRPVGRGQEHPYDTNRAPAGLFTSHRRISSAPDLRFSIDSTGNVTISAHSRVYPDLPDPVPVNGTPGTAADGTGGTPIATGATTNQYVLIFYDDALRTGGAVTYSYLVINAGGDDSPAYASGEHPDRQIVLVTQVPATGSTSGGSSPGTGGGGAGGTGGIWVDRTSTV